MSFNISSLSAKSTSSLNGTNSTMAASVEPTGAVKLFKDATGNTDDVFKAGSVIGKIIDIVAGLKQPDQMFSMDGATRIDGSGGEYSLTKTGTGTVVSDAELQKRDMDLVRDQAAGTGPEAERAQAYLKALSNGTMHKTDMSSNGVSATMTQTNSYYADGRQKGGSDSFQVKGLDEFLAANTYVANDGTLRDKTTGKYAGVEQSGTRFSYLVY